MLKAFTTYHLTVVVSFAGILFLATACQFQSEKHDNSQVVSTGSQAVVVHEDYQPIVIDDIRPQTLNNLQRFFKEMNYSWKHLDEGVPPFILGEFPQDLNDSVHVPLKKQSFFMGILPMVLLANEEVQRERKILLELLEAHGSSKDLTQTEQQVLKNLAKKYRLRGNPLTDHRTRTRLISRIDTVPPSLALAQAANESGWGSSRFAREGNNLFGEWTFKPGTGIVPNDRPPGEIYEVRKFSSLYDSVRSYLLNINTNPAYFDLRETRAQLRHQGLALTGKALAAGLVRYSTRGEAYVAEIKRMIRQNSLSRANETKLREPSAIIQTAQQSSGNGLFSSRRLVSLQNSEVWQNP
ncbi:MAG: glucosaminidase domain-containing protein [Deltaproteobacteria bacterium]|jgi:Bax protein|nr:glucosaminidase domain-containing protein [Deltaproteobacteria bacterium]MBW2477653.1 glucosaminidase domain-containing protein [Deltaproteobacteria bacterium]MBW2520726.1 glucosaminidase domain-containing protein [Deltaproteobacteria bacterium]